MTLIIMRFYKNIILTIVLMDPMGAPIVRIPLSAVRWMMHRPGTVFISREEDIMSFSTNIGLMVLIGLLVQYPLQQLLLKDIPVKM